ncbi:MAG: hypothetical protein H6620_05730 [Halobacteriovoraceae bacterium]|nr:hypothetical protein [Halobacteriovoraceae bacterium]
MFLKSLFFTLVFSFSFSSFSLDEQIDKKFEFVKNEQGQLELVKMKNFYSNIALVHFVQEIRQRMVDLKTELSVRAQANGGAMVLPNGTMLTDGLDAEQYIDHFLEELDSEGARYRNQKSVISGVKNGAERAKIYLKKAYLNLLNVNLEGVFNKIEGQSFMGDFQSKLKTFFKHFNFAIVANPNDSKFFYHQAIGKQVIFLAKDLANKYFLKDIPVANIVVYLVTEVVDRMIERRMMAQNVLLYYLNDHENRLSLNPEEVDKTVSSIYESRIDALNSAESKKAAGHWLDYGWQKHDALMMRGIKGFEKSSSDYEASTKLNFAFYEVVQGGEKMIVNSLDTNNQFDGSLAVSFYYNKPRYIRNLRLMLQIGEAAINFIPGIPKMAKGFVESYAQSWYKSQCLSESFLYSYFMSQNDEKMADMIADQISNPFWIFK